jgi:hypothetical protein
MTEYSDVMTATLGLRSNWSIIHMRTAIRDARAAFDVSQNNDIATHGPWFEDMMVHVPVAILMSAAALEANCHELIQDILDQPAGAGVFSEGHRRLLKEVLDDQSGNSLNKYRKLGWLYDKLLGEGGPVWQNASLLFKFRNHFMHFRPAWDDDAGIHDSNLVKALKTRLPIVPAYQSSFMFPYGFMTYECAKWAIETAWDFAAEFATLIDLRDDRVSSTFVNLPKPCTSPAISEPSPN